MRFQALDINTKQILAIGNDRLKLAQKAISIVGKEGYCIRPTEEEKIKLPSNWCTADGEWWIR